jgi:hypothetical protein
MNAARATILLIAGITIAFLLFGLTPRSKMQRTWPPTPALTEAPKIAVQTPATEPAPLLTDELAERRLRMMNGTNRTEFALSPQEIYSYVEANHSNALSLVTAFQATHDKEFLKRAAERFPRDPLVQSKVLLNDLFPEDRAKWIQALKESSPDNSLGGLLAARELVKNGDFAHAQEELRAIEGKTFNDFTHESMQGLEEAYLSAGRSIAEAKTLGASEVELPHYAQFKWLGNQFVDKAKEFAAQGNQDKQIEYLAENWEVATQFRRASQHGTLLGDLVGLAMQNNSLRAWPAGVEAPTGEPEKWGKAEDVLAANAAYRKDIHAGTDLFNKWFPSAPDSEVITYMDRTKALGEQNALQWLRDRHPELIQAQAVNL